MVRTQWRLSAAAILLQDDDDRAMFSVGLGGFGGRGRVNGQLTIDNGSEICRVGSAITRMKVLLPHQQLPTNPHVYL